MDNIGLKKKHSSLKMDNITVINSEKSLASHYEYCKPYVAIKIELPEEGSKIPFKNDNR